MTNAADVQFTHDVDPLGVARFFINADRLRDEPDVTPVKLQKLMYLAQANYLASTNERLFDADIEALHHGPEVHSVWKTYPGQQIITLDADPTPDLLPADVRSFLEEIWALYQDWSASALRRLIQEQAPWSDNYVEGEGRAPIPDEDLKAYFRTNVRAADRVFHPNVVVVTPEDLEDDPEADRRLAAFLSG